MNASEPDRLYGFGRSMVKAVRLAVIQLLLWLLSVAPASPTLAQGARRELDPRLAGGWPGFERDSWTAVAVSGPRAFVAGGDLEIFDLSDLSRSKHIGSFVATDHVLDVVVQGERAYLAVEQTGLVILDVSRPSMPQSIGYLDTSGDPGAIALSGDLAFLADGAGGLDVIDVSDPSRPSQIGNFRSTGAVVDVAIQGTVAYLAVQGTGLQIVDVRDAANPRRLGGLTNGQGRAVLGLWRTESTGSGSWTYPCRRTPAVWAASTPKALPEAQPRRGRYCLWPMTGEVSR